MSGDHMNLCTHLCVPLSREGSEGVWEWEGRTVGW